MEKILNKDSKKMFLLDINLIATEYRQVEFIHNMFDCQLSLN